MKEFFTRSILSIFLIAFFYFICFGESNSSNLLFHISFSLLPILVINEYFSMTKKIQIDAFVPEANIFILLIALRNISPIFDLLIITIIIILLYRSIKEPIETHSLHKLSNTLFGLLLVYGLLININANKILVFYLVILAKSTDIGGYIFGNITQKIMKNGNHKITKISPKKSWEGVLGSTIFSSLAFLIIIKIENILHLPIASLLSLSIFIGIFFTFFSLIGDLLESKIKRTCQVKDSGLIPGLGGFFDLSDSLMLTLPISHFILELIQKTNLISSFV